MEDPSGGLTAEPSSEGIVSPKTFKLVSGRYVVEHWNEFQKASVPVLVVNARTTEHLYVSLATTEHIKTLTAPQLEAVNFAVPAQWLATDKADQYALGWDRSPFFLRWHAFLELSPQRRIETFRENRVQLQERLRAARDPAERAQVIAALSESAFLANKASMSLDTRGVSALDQELVNETLLAVRSVQSTLEDSDVASALLLAIRSLSSGQLIDHIVRVFALGLAFLLDLRTQHTAGLSRTLRSAFPTIYQGLYRTILPELPESRLTSDNVIRLKGFSDDEIHEAGLGLLLHDVGKALDLGYFEGSTPYDVSRVRQHPVLGSGLFLRTYGPQFESARYIIGDHHNQLFHPQGYGLTRWDRARGGRSVQAPEACVGETLDSYRSGTSLTFWGLEAASAMDIYDALTDPGRKYQETKSPAAALDLMASEYVLAGRLDPVVFDLLVGFLKRTGVETSRPSLQERVAARMTWGRAAR